MEEAGTYKLEVQNINYHFDPVVVDILRPEDLVGPVGGEGEAAKRR